MQRQTSRTSGEALKLIKAQERTLDSIQEYIASQKGTSPDPKIAQKLRHIRNNLLVGFSLLSRKEEEEYVRSTSEDAVWRRYGVSLTSGYTFIGFFPPIMYLSFIDFGFISLIWNPYCSKTDSETAIKAILKSLKRTT